jgi:hypothetical protein
MQRDKLSATARQNLELLSGAKFTATGEVCDEWFAQFMPWGIARPCHLFVIDDDQEGSACVVASVLHAPIKSAKIQRSVRDRT